MKVKLLFFEAITSTRGEALKKQCLPLLEISAAVKIDEA